MVDRAGRPTCTERARSQADGLVDRNGRPPESLCSLEMARSTAREPLLSGNGPGRPTRSTGRELCSLYQLGRPARESLLSRSSPGRPVGATVKFLTVGRSTGRAFLPFSAANGQIFKWVINTPFELVFQQEFSRAKFSSSQVF